MVVVNVVLPVNGSGPGGFVERSGIPGHADVA